MALVLAHARMMPRIEAEERLAEINDQQCAGGAMAVVERQRLISRLQAQGRGEIARARKATPHSLAMMGIAAHPANDAPAAAESPLSDVSDEGQAHG